MREPALARELIEMIDRDQMARRRYLEDPTNDDLAREVARIDASHRERVVEIIGTIGWPGWSLVGEDGSTAAFGLVAHAHEALWDEALPLLRAAVARKDADPSHYARLLDRSLEAKGHPQEYGTQMDHTGDDVVVPAVRDPATIDDRRAVMGFPPLEEQRAELRRRLSHGPNPGRHRSHDRLCARPEMS